MSATPVPRDRLVLTVGAGADAGAVFAALADAYTVHAEPAVTVGWTWLDTADWRLHHAGLALREERRGRSRELVADTPRLGAVRAAVSGVRWPARLDALPESPPRAAVADTVGVRALLPVAEVVTRHLLLRLMDDAGKTRVRVTVDQQRLLSPRKAALPLHVTVSPLRGYDRDARRCVELLVAATGAEATAQSPTESALAAAGRLPELAPPEAIEVRADDPAVRPVARALLTHVGVVERARDGALADLDTEFLHELRSAIRSTRALLAAAGHLLPGRSAVRVERDLSWLDEQTAALRAVDIAALELAGEGGVDVTGLDGAGDGQGESVLDAVAAELQRRRRLELRRMRSTLRAPRAPAAFTAWRRDLTGMLDADLIGPTAAEASRSLVAGCYARIEAAEGLAELTMPVAGLCETLTAFRTLHAAGAGSESVDTLLADLTALRELLRLRDGTVLMAGELRATALGAAGRLPAAALLAAGAVLDRAARRASALDREIVAARDALLGKAGRKRIEALT